MSIEHCCEAGDRRGITFDERTGVRTCRRHFTVEQRALIADLDERGIALGFKRDRELGTLDWPGCADIYVSTREAMVAWAEKLQLRRVKSQSLNCVCWPTSNRRSRCECGLGEIPYGKPDHIWDHVTHWKTREGERALVVLQPYDMTDTGHAILDRWDAREDVHIEVRSDSWYGVGTTFIGIWNAAQFAARR